MKSIFKTLTFIFCLVLNSQNLFSSVIEQESLKTHLRWKIQSSRDQINISKSGNKIFLKSLDPEFFQAFSSDLVKLNQNKKYISKYKFINPEISGQPYSVELLVKNSSIELFNFYKKDSKQYILDFWINEDAIATKKSSIKKVTKKVMPKLIKKKTRPKAKKASVALAPRKSKRFSVIDPSSIESKKTKNTFRDFRYGASFVWDYKGLIPPLEKDLDLSVKAPDFLYKVKDVENLGDKKQAHMQLSINFYRKSQWGLMTRSITLYESKYGNDQNKVLNNFMKSVSMIKNTIKSSLKPEFKSDIDENGEIVPGKDYSSKGVLAAARSLLKNVTEGTDDYDLSQAVLRYLIQYSRGEKDYIQTLEYAKKLYVKSSESFDNDMIIYSSRVILNSLANLRQLDKIKDFLSNKAVMRVLPKQVGMAYISYVNIEKDDTKQIISNYKINKRGLIRPIHPSILFNTAEAYFRTSEYNKAIKIFDMFINDYSMFTKSSQARLRLALSYDLLNKDRKETLKLYSDAINKSSDLKTRYEAKIRYVGHRLNRKVQPNKNDIETIAFLNASKAEHDVMTPNLKKILWLTRLRSFISTKRYDDAIAYLSTLPLDSIRLIDKRVFNGDGAEIVLGIIQKAYLDNDYAKAVKIWEIYKDKYESKVARSPYMNFIVTDSFLKLGLNKSYERSLKYLVNLRNTSPRKFPKWVKPHKRIKVSDYIVELRLNKYLRDSDYKGLSRFLDRNKQNKEINYKFYKGLVSYHLKNYDNAVSSYENLLIRPNANNILTPTQNLEMIETYLESLFEVSSTKRFRKNASAILNDLRRSENPNYRKLVERADYLYLESLFSESDLDYKLLSRKSGEFINEFKSSNYLNRAEYLRGVSLINTNKLNEGKELLNNLIDREGVPEYLKGLVRSELSSLKLKNKTL